MSIGLSVRLCTISMGNIQRGICWVLWIHTNNSYDKSRVRILLGLFYFYFFFGQMLWNLKLLKQWKYFDYCDLLSTWMLTGVPYHLNCQSVIYSTYTLTSVDKQLSIQKSLHCNRVCIACVYSGKFTRNRTRSSLFYFIKGFFYSSKV